MTRSTPIHGQRALQFVDVWTLDHDGRKVSFAFGGQQAAEVRLLGILEHCTRLELSARNAAAFRAIADAIEAEASIEEAAKDSPPERVAMRSGRCTDCTAPYLKGQMMPRVDNRYICHACASRYTRDDFGRWVPAARNQ